MEVESAMSEETLFIPAPGFELEAAIEVPQSGGPHCGVVICHPHPQYGGDMHNNVVMCVRKALANAGMATLRFNFRGVGRSGGGLAGPDGDPEDVAVAVDYLRGLTEVAADKVAVVGYSYGAMVGLAAGMIDPRIPAMVGISPPVAGFRLDFISRIDHPLLVISGDKDMFCPLDMIRELLHGEAVLEVVDGADHLYRGYENEVGRLTTAFLLEKIGRP